MKNKPIVKHAGVFLLAALLMVSSGAVMAHTNTSDAATTSQQPFVPSSTRALIWDNVMGVHGSLGGVIVAVVRSDGIAFPADDFKLTAPAQVDSIAWQGGYFQCQLAQGTIDYDWDWRVIFWDDYGDENKPGNQIYNWTIPTASITRSFWYNFTHPTNGNTYWIANYSTQLPQTANFAANTKYWVTIQAIGEYPPQACWSRHNITHGGILLHQAVFKGTLWGYPDWTDISVLVSDHIEHDLNYQLFGTGAVDTTPPETTCTLDGTMQGGVYISDVTVTLSATDDLSGVDYTMYKVDSGTYAEYTAPFIVSEDGDHTVYFYSVDNAGNIEDEKTCEFTIQKPSNLIITITGGLGVSATIKNNGTEDLTGVAWSIDLEGGLIIIGKTKSGTVDIPTGEEATVKSFVLGLGKPTITVTADDATATATGTVFLIFVFGVS
ncbi:MAG: hypothetical protein JXA00_00555 [Candidatus Thermoplasmatota archaeon]|nr:hypothetical protein [Candidatus Thermoplasmatota archaeon]